MVTDRLSRWLFTPTQTANENLLSEGHRPESIFEVGDVMFDAFELCSPLEGSGLPILQQVHTDFVLATIHRAENTDEAARLLTIIEAFNLIADKTPVVFPVHPRTRAALADKGVQIHPRHDRARRIGGDGRQGVSHRAASARAARLIRRATPSSMISQMPQIHQGTRQRAISKKESREKEG